jgi:hypothetical protein
MKSKHILFLVFLAILLSAATPSWAQIAAVQGGNGQSATGTTCTITFPSGFGSGHTVVLFIGIRTTTVSVSSVSDTTNTWTFKKTVTNSDSTAKGEIWSSLNVSPNGAQPAATLSASTKSACVGEEYSGVQALGITGSNTGTSTTPTISLTTQDNNNWVSAGFVEKGVTLMSPSVGNGRQAIATSGGAASSNVTSFQMDNTAASPSSVTNTASDADGFPWAAAALELRSTSGGAPPPGGSKRKKLEAMDPMPPN